MGRLRSTGGTYFSVGTANGALPVVAAGTTVRADASAIAWSSSVVGKSTQVIIRERDSSGRQVGESRGQAQSISKVWASLPDVTYVTLRSDTRLDVRVRVAGEAGDEVGVDGIMVDFSSVAAPQQPEQKPTPAPKPAPAPKPTPSAGDHFNDPFPHSPLRRDASSMGFDSNSVGLVRTFLTNAMNGNSGRGPSIFDSGEQRWRASDTDPLWTVRGASTGGSTTIRAPQNVGDSGGVDPTMGIYSPSKTVRLYCGDSGQCTYDRTNHVIVGQNLGVDTNADGAPEQGIGTAWGRMSGEGLMYPRELAGPVSMIKFAGGNNDNARSFRPPARSFESKAFGPAYNPTPGAATGIPHGTVFCHTWTSAEIEAFQQAAGLSGGALSLSRAFWNTTSCTRGKGLVLGDGTGNDGVNVYIQVAEMGLTDAQARWAIRMHPASNSGAPVSNAWRDFSRWRALESQ